MTVIDPLTQAALEVERHVARAGWDQPARLFALVSTTDLVAHEPGLRDTLVDPAANALSAVEQEGLDVTDTVEALLAQIAWPDEVLGAAFAVERIVVPPEAESGLPSDPEAAVEALAAHPQRQDVRLLAAVLRTGEHVCALRQRSHDEDHLVGTGTEIAPGLISALLATFDA
ncbi:MAG: PPA1309 family protein [Dermatophilaceae bacterium]